MPKGKKKLKKKFERKKTKIIRKTLPGIDDQIKRNEMLKVMLARQSQSIVATDPEYRSLLQKNQQAKAEQEIVKMNREAKMQRDLNKADAALAAKKEQAEYDLNRQRRLNEIGKMEMEAQQIDFETRRMNRERQAMEDEIRANKTFQE